LLQGRTQSRIPDDSPGYNNDVRGVIGRNWVLFFGMMLCLSVKALTWQGYLFREYFTSEPGMMAILGASVGALIGSILILFLGWNGASQRLLKSIPFAPLLCVFLVAVAWLMGVWDQGFSLLGEVGDDLNMFSCNLPVGFASTVLSSLLVITLSAEVRNGTSPSFVFGLLVAASAGLFLLLTVLQANLPAASIGVFELTLRLLYLLLAIFYTIMMTHKTLERQSANDAQIKAFCSYYKFSKREADVFRYVLQGRSAPFIAEAEFLSLNTVQSHMKNIFSKAKVHKRQELLDLFYNFPG
jgi:DNA-binding CsgD family transcriptional regulator